MSYFQKRRMAFYYAISGLWQAFKRESHMRIHMLATLFVIAAGFYFSVSQFEWVALIACIFLVMIVELLNTALEKICDEITTDIRSTIKYIKDISAAAVLLASIFSLIVGLIIFLPRVFLLFHDNT